MEPICIFAMGRPGAGKDTQAQMLADFFHLEMVKTSALLREEFEKHPQDEAVKREKAIYDSGDLNTPSWVVQVVKKYIQDLKERNFDDKNGVVFSGSPRTVPEAEELIPALQESFPEERILAIFVEVSEEEGMKRILKRNKRDLDRDPAIIKNRMEEYAERTMPVLEYFKERDMLVSVDGMVSPEGVFKQIKDAVGKRLFPEHS